MDVFEFDTSTFLGVPVHIASQVGKVNIFEFDIATAWASVTIAAQADLIEGYCMDSLKLCKLLLFNLIQVWIQVQPSVVYDSPFLTCSGPWCVA